MTDVIHIQSLTLSSHIGVPDEERAQAQRLTVSLTLEPKLGFAALDDRIEQTVDYAAVCELMKTIASAKPRRLLETLAEELAAGILQQFPILRLNLEVRKYILPDTQFVAVRIERPLRESPSPR
ncbi:MAG: dihydroneopterin aldolase [Verrucomicrobiota bacterium]